MSGGPNEWINPATILTALGGVPTIGVMVWHLWGLRLQSRDNGRKLDLDERRQTAAERTEFVSDIRIENERLRAELKAAHLDRDKGWDLCRSWYQMAREIRHGWANAVMASQGGVIRSPPNFLPRMEEIARTGPDEFDAIEEGRRST